MSDSIVRTVLDVVVALCWGLFVVVWVVGALVNSRRAPDVKRRAGIGAYWILGLVGAWLLFHTIPSGDWHSVSTHSVWVRLVGVVLLVAFTAFTIWARVALGTMWSSSAIVRDRHVLHTDGPDAITRHPIYTGILGMLLGTTLAVGLGAVTVLFALGVVLVEVKIHTEERLLGEVFPGAYERYRQRVPQLIPGLRLGRGKR